MAVDMVSRRALKNMRSRLAEVEAHIRLLRVEVERLSGWLDTSQGTLDQGEE